MLERNSQKSVSTEFRREKFSFFEFTDSHTHLMIEKFQIIRNGVSAVYQMAAQSNFQSVFSVQTASLQITTPLLSSFLFWVKIRFSGTLFHSTSLKPSASFAVHSIVPTPLFIEQEGKEENVVLHLLFFVQFVGALHKTELRRRGNRNGLNKWHTQTHNGNLIFSLPHRAMKQ